MDNVTFSPCAIDNIVIILYFTGCSGTNSNLKNLHKIATAIFIWRYAESFPRQILGPACISINMKPGQVKYYWHILSWSRIILYYGLKIRNEVTNFYLLIASYIYLEGSELEWRCTLEQPIFEPSLRFE